MKNTKIYLAGGMRTKWQKKVKDAIKNHLIETFGDHSSGIVSVIFYDPCEKEGRDNPEGIATIKRSFDEYTTWDLHHVKMADIVFVYVERSNPGVIGSCCELSYAKGLGKTVILVLEEDHETIPDRYLNFMKKLSDVTFNNLEDGINYLKIF